MCQPAASCDVGKLCMGHLRHAAAVGNFSVFQDLADLPKCFHKLKKKKIIIIITVSSSYLEFGYLNVPTILT